MYENDDFEVAGGGILNNYRKLSGQSLDEALESDYWHANRKIHEDGAKFFNIVQKSEQDMMNNTKNFTMRYRLNREIDFSDDFRKKYMTKEYGNYEKYTKNSIETIHDDGKDETVHDKIYENYVNLIKRLPTKEADDMK
jgi:hypothetical protein